MQRTISIILFLSLNAAILLTLAAHARAQSTPPEPLEYTIYEFALMALQNNQELEVERLGPQIQEEAINEARGAFNPALKVSVNHEDRERNLDQRAFNGVSSILFGGGGGDSTVFAEVNSGVETGIEGRTPLGTQYNLSMFNRITENDANEFLAEYTSELNLTVKQPILRGFGRDYNTAVIRLAENRYEQQEFRLRSIVLSVLQETINACVELKFAQENMRVKRESIELAEQFVRENKRRVEEGRMSEIEVVQAETRLSEAKEEALQAKGFYIQRLNRLRALIYADANEYHDQPLRIDYEFDGDRNLPGRDDLLWSAKNRNPNYLLAKKQIEERSISLDRAEQDILPELNLVAGVGYQGLGFDNIHSAIDDYANRDGPNWLVGVEFVYPLGNDTALSRRRAALLGKRQAEYNLAQIENRLVTTLDQAIGNVEVTLEIIDTAADSVRLATESLEAEQTRLVNGRTTSFNVAQLQRNLSVARTRELAAYVEYEKARSTLWTLVGILDQRMNLQSETLAN